MDFMSHTLWGYALFGFRGKPGVAIASGALPDVLSFGPLIVSRLVSDGYRPGPPALSSIPAWTFTVYDGTHSLLVASLIIAIVAARRREVAWAMLAWLFHIALDAPFHTKAYFPTKLFWPLSDFAYDGVSWGHPWVWFPQLALLAGLLSFRYWHAKK